MPEQQQQVQQLVSYDDAAKLADDAANKAAAAVSESVSQSVQDGVQEGVTAALGATSEAAQVVTVDSAQWDVLENEMRLYASVGVLSLMLLAGLLGALWWRYFSEGWRKS